MKRTPTILSLIAFLLCLSAPAQAQERIGAFTIQRSNDIMTDENRSFGFSASPNGRVSVGMKCFSEGLDVLFVTEDEYLGGDSNDQVRLVYRFDNNEPVGPLNATLGTQNRAIFLPLELKNRFLEQMRRCHQLAIRIEDPLDNQIYEGVVSLSGATRAIEAIGSCP